MAGPIIGVTASFGDGMLQEAPVKVPTLRVGLAYLEAVQEAGGWPVVLPPLDSALQQAPQEVLERLDAVLLTGSDPPLPRRIRERRVVPPLHVQAPRRYHSDVLWLRGAVEARLPILAICRGMQTLNVALGGSLWPRLYPPEQAGQHNQIAPGDQPCHEVLIEPDSILAAALGCTRVWTNSFHVQGVKEPAPGLRVTARAADGVVEALEAEPGSGGEGLPWLMAVQWHPERQRTAEPAMKGIFLALVAAARERDRMRSRPSRSGASGTRGRAPAGAC